MAFPLSWWSFSWLAIRCHQITRLTCPIALFTSSNVCLNSSFGGGGSQGVPLARPCAGAVLRMPGAGPPVLRQPPHCGHETIVLQLRRPGPRGARLPAACQAVPRCRVRRQRLRTRRAPAHGVLPLVRRCLLQLEPTAAQSATGRVCHSPAVASSWHHPAACAYTILAALLPCAFAPRRDAQGFSAPEASVLEPRGAASLVLKLRLCWSSACRTCTRRSARTLPASVSAPLVLYLLLSLTLFGTMVRLQRRAAHEARL